MRVGGQQPERLAHERVGGDGGHERVGQPDVGRVRQQQLLALEQRVDPLDRLMLGGG